MGWMCVQTPYPTKEQPDAAEGGSGAGDDAEDNILEEGETRQ